jgi:L,D-transpeptidase YbiS
MDKRDNDRQIIIDLASQILKLESKGQVVFEASISSAKNGAGELVGSEQTPRGWHIIRAKIGKNLPENTVFRGRRPTGEVYDEKLARKFPQRDWILTRILWLSGLEPGFNRLGNVDTMRRYIYIHGSPDIEPVGVAESHGCIRMHNADVIRLFDQVDVGTKVLITE